MSEWVENQQREDYSLNLLQYILSKENTIDGESAVIISFLQINEEEIILEFRSLENQGTDPTNLPVWS